VTSLVYVYAVLPQPTETRVKGIDAQLVRWVVGEGLAAAVSDVSSDEFDEAPLNEQVRDLSWLGPRALAHEEVNDKLHEDADAIVPLAFGTVFRDDDRVQQLLRDERPSLEARLAAVRGCAEWVLALHLVQTPDAEQIAQASSEVRQLRAEIESSSPGRGHLLKRRLTQLEQDASRELQARAAEDLLRQVRDVSADVYAEPLPSEAVERPLVRATALVQRVDEPRFLDQVERLRAQWPEPTYRLQLTGPWPPYRFSGLHPEDG
jgi:hypothetical protein